MKRRDFICGAGLAALSLLVGCSGDSQSNQDATSGRLPALAVIETRPHVAPSRIHWLDSDLEALGSTEINHAAVGDYSRPAVMDGKLLLAPTGPTGRNDDKTVLSIELDDFRVTEYALDAVNNYCIAAAGGHAFVGGNLNFSSHISKVNLANGDVQSLTLSKLILDSIISDTSNLYAFAWEDINGAVRSSLHIYDLDLNAISRVSLDACGYSAFRPRIFDDRIFIPSWTSITNQNSRSSTLGVYDISSRALETVELKRPILETIPADNGLIIIHGDIHQTSSTRTEAALLDYETWAVKSESTLPCHAVQAEILDNELCVLDSSDRLHLVSLDGRWSERLSLAFTPSLDDSHISSFIAV